MTLCADSWGCRHERAHQGLQKRLLDGGIDAALLVYSRDILYYTGTAQPSCLLVTPDDYTLYVRSGFEFAVQDVFIGREKLAKSGGSRRFSQAPCPGWGESL